VLCCREGKQTIKQTTMPPKLEDFSSVAKQADLLRKHGNNYFKKHHFGAAIDAYTQVCFFFLFFSGLLIGACCHFVAFAAFLAHRVISFLVRLQGDCTVPRCSGVLDQSRSLSSQAQVWILNPTLFCFPSFFFFFFSLLLLKNAPLKQNIVFWNFSL